MAGASLCKILGSKQIERQVGSRRLALLSSRLCRFTLENNHQLTPLLAAGVQAVAAPALRMLDEALWGARMALHIILHKAVHIGEVGLRKKSTRMVVDVLGKLFNADATRAYIQ